MSFAYVWLQIEHQWVQIGEDKIWEEKEVRPIGINIDNELKFDQRFTSAETLINFNSCSPFKKI